jgi:hypothetical protein
MVWGGWFYSLKERLGGDIATLPDRELSLTWPRFIGADIGLGGSIACRCSIHHNRYRFHNDLVRGGRAPDFLHGRVCTVSASDM